MHASHADGEWHLSLDCVCTALDTAMKSSFMSMSVFCSFQLDSAAQICTKFCRSGQSDLGTHAYLSSSCSHAACATRKAAIASKLLSAMALACASRVVDLHRSDSSIETCTEIEVTQSTDSCSPQTDEWGLSAESMLVHSGSKIWQAAILLQQPLNACHP